MTLGAKEIEVVELSIAKVVLESEKETVYSVRRIDTGMRYNALENDLFLTKDELLNSLRGL